MSPDQTWDLEILEFKVAEDYDLVALHDKLEKEQFSSYLDSKGNLLALTDMSNIEVWFTKLMTNFQQTCQQLQTTSRLTSSGCQPCTL